MFDSMFDTFVIASVGVIILAILGEWVASLKNRDSVKVESSTHEREWAKAA